MFLSVEDLIRKKPKPDLPVKIETLEEEGNQSVEYDTVWIRILEVYVGINYPISSVFCPVIVN